MNKDEEIERLKAEIELHKKTISEWQNVATNHFENSEKLQAFKDYVHNRLDEMGIEKDPESEHKEKGCRIGGRLDIVERGLSQRDELLNKLSYICVVLKGSFDKETIGYIKISDAEELITKINSENE